MDPRSHLIHTAVSEIAHKSENMPLADAAQIYVDMGHVTRLLNPNNQYVDGRRGTGKTHLFSFLTEHIRANASRDHNTAIYLDIRHAEVESGPLRSDARSQARVIFIELLRKIAVELRRLAEQEFFFNNIPVERGPWESWTAERTVKILDDIWTTIEVGEYRDSDHRKRSTKTTRQNTTKAETGLAADTAASKVGILGSISRLWKEDSEQIDEAQAVSTIPYSKIGSLIEAFLEANEIGRLFILIDEWSSISSLVQPYLAESIKRTFFPLSRTVIKVACIPFQRHFSLSDGADNVGFQPGGDIYLAFDLDDELVYYRNPSGSKGNFIQLIHNHISFNAPKPSGLPETAIETVNALITDAAHERMLKYSHGNPRDYLTLFRKSYFKFYPSGVDRITSELVDQSAKELGAEKFESVRDSSSAQQLLKKIVGYVLHDKQLSAFFVKSDLIFHQDLLYLIHARVLHVWEKSYSAPRHKGEIFHMLCIDFSLMVEHLRAPNYRPLLVLPFTPADRQNNAKLARENKILSLSTPDKREVRYCILPDGFLENPQQDGVVCSQCGQVTPTNHPIYSKHRLCVGCGEPCG